MPLTSFSLRNRIKLDLQRTKPVSSNVNRAKNLSHDTRSKSESFSNVTRMETGRPGARISRALIIVSLIYTYMYICVKKLNSIL